MCKQACHYIDVYNLLLYNCILAYIGMFSYKIETCYVSQRPLNMPCEVSTLSYPHTESIKALYKVRVIYSIKEWSKSDSRNSV